VRGPDRSLVVALREGALTSANLRKPFSSFRSREADARLPVRRRTGGPRLTTPGLARIFAASIIVLSRPRARPGRLRRNQPKTGPMIPEYRTIEAGRIRLKISGAELCGCRGGCLARLCRQRANGPRSTTKGGTIAKLRKRACQVPGPAKGQEARALGAAAALRS